MALRLTEGPHWS